MFTDTLQSMLSYERAFKGDFSMRFVNFCMMDIVHNIALSNFLTTKSRANYIRYIRVGIMTMTHKGVPSLLLKLGIDTSAPNNLSITYHDDANLWISFEASNPLLFYAADSLIYSDHKPALFDSNAIYKDIKVLFNALHVPDSEQGEQRLPAFALFLETKIQQKTLFYLILFFFIATIRSFDYDARGTPKI